MSASAPSKIAVETSETSARVGRRWVTIDSSICVATMTGTPASRACRMISFWRWRSEEHTSELQSQSNLVCRLLLEKKKKQNRQQMAEKWPRAFLLRGV